MGSEVETTNSLDVFPAQPLLETTNSTLRDYLRYRDLDRQQPIPVLAIPHDSDDPRNVPSDELLRSQLSFDGVGPIAAEDFLEQAAAIRDATEQLEILNRRFAGIQDGASLGQDAHVQQLSERKSRVARWWRHACRSVVMWSLVAAAALVVVTALLSRYDLSLQPVIVTGIVITVVIVAIAALIVVKLSRQSTDANAEHSLSLWEQSLAALEYQSAFENATKVLTRLSRQNVGSLESPAATSGIVESFRSVQDRLNSTISACFWHYKGLVTSVRDAAAADRNDSLFAEAENHLRELVGVEHKFGSPYPVNEDESSGSISRFRLNLSHDRHVAVILAALFALIATPVIVALPSVAIANDACSYAVAQVRIDKCENLTRLKAAGLNAPKVNLSGRDVSESDFSDANLREANLTETDLSFTTLTGAKLFKVSANKSDFSGASAEAIDLSEALLDEANLAGVLFAGARLTGSIVTKADFTGSIFTNASLASANATGANFSDADLTNVDFTNANLTNAIFVGADLSGADLKETKLSGADMTGAVLRGIDLGEVDLTGVILDRVDLSNLDLTEYDLSGLSLAGANLSGANLTNASLEGTNLVGANLSGATIKGVKLAGAALGGVSVKALLDGGANLENVDLSGADLTGLAGAEINLPGATLNGVDLSGFDLAGAILDGASLIEANLDGADMAGASFEGANLSGASLQVAEMSEANFTGASFGRADLTDARALRSVFERASFVGARLDGADFSESNMSQATGLASNAAAAQWRGATCPRGQTSEICRS